ncbi:tripartite tricarboxylate transporter substrate binding protein [Ramlibacter sp.]|uniref:Bug family tripartite tricarboxylate transporter substrate binding protein n=1 Tax=Ramlibacter sp. TaxID=1917967 RepID=UPI0017D4E5D9|nr:tripartite tricarboxylate transporter substrate binding protein [Ramlibacter sp.]MBA2672878.1 tripartite tricarboxylate transporter substrate binding protein [Ramlibacter sp.]
MVRLVVPAPPGGNLDTTARLLAQRLSAVSGEPYVVDNRPGANTQIGAETVVRSPADGYTLLYSGTSLAFLPLLQKVGFSPLADLAPVAQVTREHYVLAVHANSPAGNLAQLAELARSKDGGLNCAAYPGVTAMACEQLRVRLDGKATTIPFQGVAPTVNAVLGGHADLLFVNSASAAKLVASGRLRVLAQTSGAGLSGVPVLTDRWPGFLLEGHSGVLAPAGTPTARIRQLNRDINRVLQEPDVLAVLGEGGQYPVGGSPQQYGEVFARTYAQYGAIIQKLNLNLRAK